MNQLDKMRQLAGIDFISEAMGSENSQIVSKIMQMAEAIAYDAGANHGNVTSDEVMHAAKQILNDIERSIVEKLELGMDQDQSAEIEQEMGADRNMERGETNFNDPDTF